MILSYPEFMRTKFFNRDYKHPKLSKDAPQRLKNQFEDYYNDPKYEDFPAYLRKTHPDIKNPYITWEGKVIDLTDQFNSKLKKIALESPFAEDMVIRALEIAAVAHAGQLDKAGVAYITHPITVAGFVDTAEEKIVAYLHDVVEDTDVTLSDLKEEGFDLNIINAVDAITHREGETRYDYLMRVKENPLARKVKLADLKHNSDLSRIPNPTEKDIKRREKYLKEMEYLTPEDDRSGSNDFQ